MEVYSIPFPDLGHPRIKARLQLPEAYRSLTTSFFGSWCQGIHTCAHISLTNSSLESSLSSLFLTPTCQRPSSGDRSLRRRFCTRRSGGTVGATPLHEALSTTFSCTTEPPHLPIRYGDGRNRTGDLLVANQTLYQLSYAPSDSHTPRRPGGPLGRSGRPEWTRTTDLSLIRRTL